MLATGKGAGTAAPPAAPRPAGRPGRGRPRLDLPEAAPHRPPGAPALPLVPDGGVLAQGGQQVAARGAAPLQLRQRGQGLGRPGLGLADEHRVHEAAEGERVGHRGPPGDDDGPALAAVAAEQADPAGVQDGQQVGQGQLVAHGEAQQVELAQRGPRLQRVQGQAAGAQLRLEVRRRGEDPLAGHAGQGVEQPVQQAHRQVGHADLVEVRVGDGHAQEAAALLHHAAVFAAGVAAGLGHPQEDVRQVAIDPYRTHEVRYDTGSGRERPPARRKLDDAFSD